MEKNAKKTELEEIYNCLKEQKSLSDDQKFLLAEKGNLKLFANYWNRIEKTDLPLFQKIVARDNWALLKYCYPQWSNDEDLCSYLLREGSKFLVVCYLKHLVESLSFEQEKVLIDRKDLDLWSLYEEDFPISDEAYDYFSGIAKTNKEFHDWLNGLDIY